MRQFVNVIQKAGALLAILGVVAVSAPVSAAKASCLPASLNAKLSQIRAKFGPVRIISTHRKGARIAGTGKRSYHASCRAVDFYPPRGKYGQVVAWLKANHSGGVGTYSGGMHHIHIDNGSRVRFHKRVNSRGARVGKKGKRRRYSGKRRNRKYTRSGSGRRYAKKRRSNSKKSRRYASKNRKAKRVRVVRAPNPIGRITAYSR